MKEFREIATRIGQDVTEEDIVEAFKLYDVDLDGKLNFEEYLKMMRSL